MSQFRVQNYVVNYSRYSVSENLGIWFFQISGIDFFSDFRGAVFPNFRKFFRISESGFFSS